VTEDGGPDGGDGVTEDGGPGTSNGTCRCGKKKTQRIVGGSEAEVNEYPWIAIFGDSNGDNLGGCSSTLIGNNWALTAAHCFFNPDSNQQDKFKDDLTVVLGVHDRTIVVTPDTPLSERKVLKISEIVLHPDYNQATSSSNDIALLKFTESVELEKYAPACLAEQDADFSSGQTGWVYGWGVTSENGFDLAEKLQELEVPIVSDAVCRSTMEGEGVTITDDMLCAGGQEGKDSCGGDSGGPFTVEVGGIHTLAGVVSFGIGCARDGLYGVYAEVAQFRGWIDETIRDKDTSAIFCN
jgi:secreted trypsin-like serine protease